jgi:chemosensory pili system protein ChpA (sensor histidine kinase/response regulator)
MAELSSQTLHLVARELASELNEARAALETFGDQQDNVAQLKRCGAHLHTVHGALRVAEVYGAALLAEEMGQVTRYLIDNFAEKRHLAEGLDALMRAMVQLPTYLERVMSGGRDMALVLLPLLNDLRAVRGNALLSEGTLLLLNLSSDQQASPVPANPGEGLLSVSQWARKLRTRFQLGLLGWIKGERIDQNLEVLSRAAEKLEQVATTQPVFQLWWVVGAVLEALRDRGLEGSASVKRLLGQADRDMRRLYEQGEIRYAEAPSLELLNNLLYYVARARSSGPRVAAVRASFRLTELLPVDDQVEQARESLSAPSVKLMKTVAAAIKEDLGRVKDALDIFVRQGGTQVEQLNPQLELLKKIADTLGVLGLGELRDKVQSETAELQAIVTQRAPVGEGTLLRMAATLIKVEDSLDEQLVGMIVPTAGEVGRETPSKPAGPDEIEFRQVTEAVLRECIVNMARIKEAVAHSMEKQREGQAIDQIPQLVRGITAGLLMLGKTRAVEIMEGIDRALAQFVRSDGMTLPQEAVDRLADAIVAVEYYMETLQAGRADPWYMLDNAESCLKYLSETQRIPKVEDDGEREHVRTVVLIEPTSTTVAAVTEHDRTAVLNRQLAAGSQAAATPPPVVQPADREIDPEFLELFIEEAKDEIGKLQRLFPLWDENPQDQESLANVRRCFHTLKGSGRMVGAQLIGEFAWSVESLLNRVINKTLDRTPDMMALLRQAVAAVPQLVEQLETGRAPQMDIGKLIETANNISGTRPPAPAPVQRPAVTPAPMLTETHVVAQPPVVAPQKKTAEIAADTDTTAMEPGLREIYAKETAGHLATIREFIAAGDLSAPPYPVTEDLHRSCHTLSGTAKTAGARQGIKIAEPLNRYIRKLYDNSAGLPEAGMDVLKDAEAAIRQVVDHIGEDTGFFVNHGRIVARLAELEHALDLEVSRLTETMDASLSMMPGTPDHHEAFDDMRFDDMHAATHVVDDAPVQRVELEERAAPTPSLPALLEAWEGESAEAVFVDAPTREVPIVVVKPPAEPLVDELPGMQALAEPAAPPQQVEVTLSTGETVTIETLDLIELPPTDANELQMLQWSYQNFPPDQAAASEAAPSQPEPAGISEPQAASEPPLEIPAAPAADSPLESIDLSAVEASPEIVLFDDEPGGSAATEQAASSSAVEEAVAEEIVLEAGDAFSIDEPGSGEFAGAFGSDASDAAPEPGSIVVEEMDPADAETVIFLQIETPAEEIGGEGIVVLESPADGALPDMATPDVAESPTVSAPHYRMEDAETVESPMLTAIPPSMAIEIDSVPLNEEQLEAGALEPIPEAWQTELQPESELQAQPEPEPVPLAATAEPPPVVVVQPPEPAPPMPVPPVSETQPIWPSAPPPTLERPLAVAAYMAPPAAAAAALEEPEIDENFDPDVAAIFTEEASELLEAAQTALSSWMRDRANNALVFELKRVVHTLKGGARMAGIRAMGDLSHELETLMERVEGGHVPGSEAVFQVFQASLDELHRMRDIVAQGGRCKQARELMARLRALDGREPVSAAPVVSAPIAPAVELPPAVLEAPVAEALEIELTSEPEPPRVEAPAPVLTPVHEIEDMMAPDASSTDIVPMLTESVETPLETAQDPVLAEAGAEIAAGGEAEFDVEYGADELGAAAPREAVRVEESTISIADAAPATLDVAARAPELLPDPPEAPAVEMVLPALPPGREPQQQQERQEFARVDADLLDNLLNNAGEVSIFRSRLEQQVSSIEFNLAELGRTVTRLKDQLRKLELETEAQILHRRQEQHPDRADFDPLELDRYSTIQQLTRAFAESVSDVGSIEGLLENLTREGQNLLLQQARVVTELQNGLMRTRMVPFQRHVQRLSRLVRQVAADTGKRAEFVVVGASGELDRQVLDRMLPPFEHMLRNSVVHGIEMPQERAAKGKPEGGTIRVGLHREGSEMVIVLEDDGRGIDVNAVRERAQARGLVHPGRVLSDEEALQLILEPGFSTASVVTQHAGRGVGMDVVVNEIKKLGGALFTESKPGQGVKFTIRLPFTLAITQALIVRTGDELYALPLPSVEGVARVPKSEVQKHLNEETPTFNYGGQVYRFQHLGAFVGGGPSLLPETDVSIPLILIRAGEHSTAIVTDELVGSREMVVKAVGPQIATIRGISGATIMGDGRIVIILDMGAMVRSEWRGRTPLLPQGPKQDRRTFALVVDDSITVRRVTQRLLERNGMRVLTAKDGVDALSLLQENLPDVILLDIEMPRMDGYELATHVRADARLADIPIVMITSRVGEKHRARAIELGVNDYLGKPYQENQLLDAIEPLVQARRQKVS